MNQNRSYFKVAMKMCLCTALWFAFGGALKTLIAHYSGKQIEMVVCTGAGMKKIYVKLSGSEPASPEMVVKHCSNAPLALLPAEWAMPQNLGYVAPHSLSDLQLTDDQPALRNWLRDGRPPPGRAPPAHFAA